MIGADRAAQGMTSRQESYIFHIPFNFTAVAHGTQETYRVAVNQGDMLIHGMTTWNAHAGVEAPDTNIYWLRLLNREYNQSLMSNWVAGLGILEASAKLLFRFPSPWYVRKGTYLDLTLRNPSDAELGTDFGVAYTVTTQHVLIAQVFPRGLEAPSKQPFLLSYMSPLGFQEDTISGGNILNSMNIYPSYQASWPPLMWDFELTSIGMDSGVLNFSSLANIHMLQVIERNTKRTLLDGPATQCDIAGSRIQDMVSATGITLPAAFPNTDSLIHNLPVPILCKKGSQLSAKVSFNLNYALTAGVDALSDLNQTANIVLMGNKFEDPSLAGQGSFNNIRMVS